MSLIRLFTAHPASVGESYFEHLGRAVYFGSRMVFAGIACLMHGVLPFLFVRTGSHTIADLNERMGRRARALPALAPDKRLTL